MKPGQRWVREVLELPADWRDGHEAYLPFSVKGFRSHEVWPSVFRILTSGTDRLVKGIDRAFDGSAQRATAQSIAETLSEDGRVFVGFDDTATQTVLADLLLCCCVGAADRDKPIQHVVPTHREAMRLESPDIKKRVRDVPLLVAEMLRDPDFRAGSSSTEDALLSAFSQGKGWEAARYRPEGGGNPTDPCAELDQLLTIRMAQKVRGPLQPPQPVTPSSSERLIATKAWDVFAEDINLFMASYAGQIPRRAFISALESCLAVGLSGLLAGTVQALVHWREHGKVPEHTDQRPFPLLANCSSETIPALRWQAEASFSEFWSQVRDVPVILMTISLLEHAVAELKLGNWQAWSPTRRLGMLGDLLRGGSRESEAVLCFMREKVKEIETANAQEDREPIVPLETARDDNPVTRLAEGLVSLDDQADVKLRRLVLSAFGSYRPSGLATKRDATVSRGMGVTKVPRQQIVLASSVLDYLVHLFVASFPGKPGARGQTFTQFLEWARDRYGIHVDQQSAGNEGSSDLTADNRLALERRMCDLGFLESVNDAEEMKIVRGRFSPRSLQ